MMIIRIIIKTLRIKAKTQENKPTLNSAPQVKSISPHHEPPSILFLDKPLLH